MVPASVATLNLSYLIVALCVNTTLITLIATRIWYLSPRKRSDGLGVSVPDGTGQTAFAISIECGMICFSTLLVYCVLFAINSNAQVILRGIEVQVYVRIRHLEGNLLWTQYPNLISQGIAPTLIYIRLSGLLNSRSMILISSGTRPRTISAPRVQLTKLGSSRGKTTTTSTDVTLAVKVSQEVSKSETECKPSSGDLGSNFTFEDCDTAV